MARSESAITDWQWLEDVQLLQHQSLQSHSFLIAIQRSCSGSIYRGYVLTDNGEKGLLKFNPDETILSWGFDLSTSNLASHHLQSDGTSINRSETSMPYHECTRNQILQWIRYILSSPSREKEVITAVQRLVELYNDSSISATISYVNSIQNLLNLPISVKNPFTGSIDSYNDPIDIAEYQIAQSHATSTDLLAHENWFPRTLRLQIIGVTHCNQTMRWIYRFHLRQNGVRLSANFELFREAHNDLFEKSNFGCLFEHILPTTDNVSLVAEIGEVSDRGMKFLGVGVANISSLLKPNLAMESRSQRFTISMYTLKPGDVKGWGFLSKRMISGGATGILRCPVARKIIVSLTADPDSAKIDPDNNIPHVKSNVCDSVNISEGERAHIELGMIILTSASTNGRKALHNSESLWISINGQRSAFATNNQEIGLDCPVLADSRFTIELYYSDQLVARGSSLPRSGVSRMALSDVREGSAPLVFAQLTVYCSMVAPTPLPTEISQIFSSNFEEIISALIQFKMDDDWGKMWFEPLMKRVIECFAGTHEYSPKLASAAFESLLEMLNWVNQPKFIYLFDSKSGMTASGFDGLIRELVSRINTRSHTYLIDIFNVFDLIGELIHFRDPTVERADALLPLTQALMSFFQSPPSRATGISQSKCLDHLEYIFFPPSVDRDDAAPEKGGMFEDSSASSQSSLNVSSTPEARLRLATQFGSIIDCITRSKDLVASSLYGLIQRAAKLKIFKLELEAQFTSHIYKWSLNYWETSSNSAEETQAMLALLKELSNIAPYFAGLVKIGLSLNISTIDTPLQLFPSHSKRTGGESSKIHDSELFIEVLLLLLKGEGGHCSPRNLITLAEKALRLQIPQQWISLRAIILKSALSLLVLARQEIHLDSRDDSVNDPEKLWSRLIICSLQVSSNPMFARYASDRLVQFSIQASAGDIRKDALDLVLRSWEDLDLMQQSSLYSSSQLYSELLKTAMQKIPDELPHAVEVCAKILFETMKSYVAANEGDLNGFADFFVRSLDEVTAKGLSKSWEFAPLFNKLKSMANVNGPNSYQTTLNQLQEICELYQTCQLIPESILAKQNLIVFLEAHGYIQSCRRQVMKQVEKSHGDARATGFIYKKLAGCYTWTDSTTEPISAPALPPQTEAQRREKLLDLAGQYFEKSGDLVYSIGIYETICRHFIVKPDYPKLAQLMKRLERLYATMAKPKETNSWSSYYLITIPAGPRKFGKMSGRSYIYNGRRKRLTDVINIISTELALKDGDDNVMPSIHTLEPDSPLSTARTLEPIQFNTTTAFLPRRFMRYDKSEYGIKLMMYHTSDPLESLSDYTYIEKVTEKHLSSEDLAIHDMDLKTKQISDISQQKDPNLQHMELLLLGVIHAPVNGGISKFSKLLADERVRRSFLALQSAVASCLDVYGRNVPAELEPQYIILCEKFAINFSI